MAVINTLESAYTHFWLPSQYPLAYSSDQKNEAPIRFAATAALNWGSGGLRTVEGRVLSILVLWGAEYVPLDGGTNEKKKGVHANQSRVKMDSTTKSQGGGGSPSVGSTYNYIYSKPFGNTSPRGTFGGSGFTTGQQGALEGFLNVVNAGSFDAQAFVSALQGVLNAFGGTK